MQTVPTGFWVSRRRPGDARDADPVLGAERVRAPSASAAATSAHRAVALDQLPAGRARARSWPRWSTRPPRRGRTPTSRRVPSAGRHQPAGAGLGDGIVRGASRRRPGRRRRASSEKSASPDGRVTAAANGRMPPRRRGETVATSSSPRRRQVVISRDLERKAARLAGRAAWLRSRLRDADEPEHPPSAARRRRARWRRPARRAPGPTSRAARRAAGQHQHRRFRRPRARADEAGGRAHGLEDRRAGRHQGLLATAGPHARLVGARSASQARHDRPDALLERCVERQLAPGEVGHDLRGEIVAVGPRPPEVMTMPTLSRVRNSSAARTSSGRSPVTMMCATCTPRSRSRSDSQGPLRSPTPPDSTSVPVTTMP